MKEYIYPIFVKILNVESSSHPVTYPFKSFLNSPWSLMYHGPLHIEGDSLLFSQLPRLWGHISKYAGTTVLQQSFLRNFLGRCDDFSYQSRDKSPHWLFSKTTTTQAQITEQIELQTFLLPQFSFDKQKWLLQRLQDITKLKNDWMSASSLHSVTIAWTMWHPYFFSNFPFLKPYVFVG